MKTLWSALLMAALLGATAPAAEAVPSAYARYTAPLPLVKFKIVRPGWTFSKAETQLGVRFKYVGHGHGDLKLYRHWTTSARVPYAELWVNQAGLVTGTTHTGLR
jgi:hypothetical protein